MNGWETNGLPRQRRQPHVWCPGRRHRRGHTLGSVTYPHDDHHRALGVAVEAIETQIVGAYTSYTPTLTASSVNPTLGSGSSATGYYKRLGRRVFGYLDITFGSSGAAAGTGYYGVLLPVQPANRDQPIGIGYILDSDDSLRLKGLHGVGGCRLWAASTSKKRSCWWTTPRVMGSSRGQPRRRSSTVDVVGIRPHPRELRLRSRSRWLMATVPTKWADDTRTWSDALGAWSRAGVRELDATFEWSRRPTRRPVWEDITDYVLSGRIDRGRQSGVRPHLSRAHVAASRQPGPDVRPGEFNNQARPNVRIRATVGSGGDLVSLYDGYIDGLPQAYDPPNDATVQLTATDGFKALARHGSTRSTGAWSRRTARGAGGVSRTTCRRP